MMNIQTCLIAFFIIYVLQTTPNSKKDLKQTPYELALFPFLLYFTSIITASQIGFLFYKMGRGKALTLGCFLQLVGAVLLLILGQGEVSYVLMYVAMFLVGVS